MPNRLGHSVFQLRITLEGVAPAVWRRLLVPGDVRLAKLHGSVQAAMGWTNSHLHSFTIGNELYGMHADDYPDDEIDETEVTLLRAIGEYRSFSYDYDFGDGWEHAVVVEDAASIPNALRHAVGLDGQNACPPEDSGGPGRYSELIEVLANPLHDEHEHVLRWLGGPIDPTRFDLAAANADLQRVR